MRSWNCCNVNQWQSRGERERCDAIRWWTSMIWMAISRRLHCSTRSTRNVNFWLAWLVFVTSAPHRKGQQRVNCSTILLSFVFCINCSIRCALAFDVSHGNWKKSKTSSFNWTRHLASKCLRMSLRVGKNKTSKHENMEMAIAREGMGRAVYTCGAAHFRMNFKLSIGIG